MKRKKSVDSAQILFVCVVGTIGIFAGLILFGVIQSYFTPKVTIGKTEIINVVKSDISDTYEVIVSIKNHEKKSIKANLITKVGFDVYRTRHTTSPKPSFYRFFQVLKESEDEIRLSGGNEQEFRIILKVEHATYKNFEIKPDTKIYARTAIEKGVAIKEAGKI